MKVKPHVAAAIFVALLASGCAVDRTPATSGASASPTTSIPQPVREFLEPFSFTSFEEMVATSHVIIEGTATSSADGPTAGDALDPLHYEAVTISIDNVLKGSFDEPVWTLLQDREFPVVSPLEVGDRVIFFLYSFTPGKYSPISTQGRVLVTSSGLDASGDVQFPWVAELETWTLEQFEEETREAVEAAAAGELAPVTPPHECCEESPDA